MSEILQITKANALDAHSSADAAGKALLEKLFGKKHFCSDMRELIKSFEDACEFNNTNPQDARFTQGTAAGNAMEMIAEIAKALNGGKVMKPNEKRYYPWFEYTSSGFRFLGSIFGFSFACAGGGPRLCVMNSDLAAYMGKQFLHLYDKLINA